MATEWFRRAFGAAASEIRLMRQEREWAKLDELVGKVDAKLDALNAHQADRYSSTRLHWEPGRLVWQGEPPTQLRGIGQPPSTHEHERDPSVGRER